MLSLRVKPLRSGCVSDTGKSTLAVHFAVIAHVGLCEAADSKTRR